MSLDMLDIHWALLIPEAYSANQDAFQTGLTVEATNPRACWILLCAGLCTRPGDYFVFGYDWETHRCGCPDTVPTWL